MFATLFDGITRHSPEGLWFKRYAEAHGFQAAAEWRDSGRPLPEPAPGTLGDEFMAAPPARDARSRWSSGSAGQRQPQRTVASNPGCRLCLVAAHRFASWRKIVVIGL